METKELKNRLRAEMKELRNGLDVLTIDLLSDEAFQNLKGLDFGIYDKVFIYNSFGGELNTRKIIEWFLQNGKQVYLPRVEGDVMLSVQITDETSFKRSKFGILEPNGDSQEIDNFVAIMPCLCVDKNGNRIGYGGGYYDKFLINKSAKKIVICYDFQILDEIVPSEYDVKADYVVTDKQIISLLKDNEKEK